MKNCNTCNISKDIKAFYINKATNDGYTINCIECVKKYNQKWRYKSKNYLKEKNKQYELLNPRQEYRKKYRLKNKEKLSKYDQLWKEKKKKVDVGYKILDLLRVRINKALKNNSKYSSSIKLLGCSIIDYKQYIEQQFKPEMTWQNHGKIWEIDHIIPCIKFDLTKLEEQQKCFHHTNTRPIFKTTRIAEQFGYLDEIGNRNRLRNGHI